METQKMATVCVGIGNKKIGAHVPTFSLPSKITCPGKSDWCVNHCYADRFERMRPNIRRAYERNLAICQYPVLLVNFILNRLTVSFPWFRIHPSGDFFDVGYINAWTEIVAARPNIQFWSYTRSWAVDELRAPLEQLKALPNMHLYGSTDPSMPLPPDGWPVAFIEHDERATGTPCQYRFGNAASCLECGYCLQKDNHNVIFKQH